MPNDTKQPPQHCGKIPQTCGSDGMTFGVIFDDFLDREFRLKRNGAKLLALAAGGVSHRTAENWLRRICAPRHDELIELMRNCEELRAEIIRITAKDTE